jgi:hypothetical protein
MWRSVLLGIVLAGVVAGCSLGGGSGAGSDQRRDVMTSRLDLSHDQPGVVGENVWAAWWVKRMHPTGGAHFSEVKCDVKKHRVVACTGYLSYGDAPGARVPQYFRIRHQHGLSARVVPYCPSAESAGLSTGGTMPLIFCPQ